VSVIKTCAAAKKSENVRGEKPKTRAERGLKMGGCALASVIHGVCVTLINSNLNLTHLCVCAFDSVALGVAKSTQTTPCKWETVRYTHTT